MLALHLGTSASYSCTPARQDRDRTASPAGRERQAQDFQTVELTVGRLGLEPRTGGIMSPDREQQLQSS